MKKILTLFLLAFILIPSTSVLAGSDDDEKLYKGIRAGYQASNFSESDWDDLTSFYVGIFGAKRLGAGKLLSLYTGLEYYQTGASEDADNEIILGYLSLPINLRVKLGPVYAFGGFNPSFKISEDAKFLGVDIADDLDINGFDIGGQLGLGAKIAFIGVELKYNLGLTSVFTNSVDEDNTTEHLQAGVCVYF
jgi:Outer membrane protein beta-barrel domain